jgi:hypothetical protein
MIKKKKKKKKIIASYKDKDTKEREGVIASWKKKKKKNITKKEKKTWRTLPGEFNFLQFFSLFFFNLEKGKTNSNLILFINIKKQWF